jgi:hypothetical protein
MIRPVQELRFPNSGRLKIRVVQKFQFLNNNRFKKTKKNVDFPGKPTFFARLVQ